MRRPIESPMSNMSPTALLLNVGHALDHLFLLIFATAVAAIAAEWGLSWQDLMPYTAGAFVMFGLGALPAGRLGDLWGRRRMGRPRSPSRSRSWGSSRRSTTRSAFP